MQTSNVVSLKAKDAATIAPFLRVKMSAGGVEACGALDQAIGTVLPGDLNREYPTIQLFGAYTEALQGNATAIVEGDLLEQAAGGKLVKKTTGTAVAVAITGGTAVDDRIDAVTF